ncbi:MAG TPA: glycosyl hydrolase family 18 protein, partial [Tepidisphaeraceae bacterium]|nr:glycosyl hydrolase family 18 protein [Tepidisphaeraceae bacterium]
MDQLPRRRGRQVQIEPLESRTLLSVSELIRNGSFEGSAVAERWGTSGSFFADSRFSNVHSGLGYAYLSTSAGSGGNNLTGSLHQQLTIPAGAGPLKLSFWTKITTSETTTSAPNDVMSVQVRSASGASVLHSVASLSNLNKSDDYVKWSFALPDALKGQTVRVQFNGSTNGSLSTVFRVDDVGLSASVADTSKKVVGYLPVYRQGMFSRMDFGLVTHLNYFAIKVNADGSLNSAAVPDADLATVVTGAHAKGVGVSITIGPQSFGTVAADPAARAAFAANIVTYCLDRNLDGVDIDWEPPATGTNHANYALLIDDLYAAASPHGLKLTAATNPWTQEIPVAATNQMDWVNVMCYDFHYANNSTYEASIDGLIQWSDYGVEKHKLLMGTPFYGRSGTSWSDTKSKSYSAFFNEYQALHGQPPAPDVDSFVDANGVTWYVNGITTIQKKMAFVRDNGYGGAMIWELGQDYWNASTKYDRHSLLPVIHSMLRPPTWLSPAAGSRFYLVNNKEFFASFGTMTLAGDVAAASPGLALSVAGGATAILGATQKIGGLSIDGGGTLDLKDKDLIIDHPAGGASPLGSWNGSAYTGVTGMVQSGRAGGAWTGSGIVTTLPAAAGAKPLTALGVSAASTALGISGAQTKLWGGKTVDASSVLI